MNILENNKEIQMKLNWTTRSTTSIQHIMLIEQSLFFFFFFDQISKLSYDRILNRIQPRIEQWRKRNICSIFSSFIAHIDPNWNECQFVRSIVYISANKIWKQNSRKLLKNNMILLHLKPIFHSIEYEKKLFTLSLYWIINSCSFLSS